MREVFIFLAILVVLSLVQHPDIIGAPIDRALALPTSGAYGIGALHPVVFTLAIYLVVLLFRSIVKFVQRLFVR